MDLEEFLKSRNIDEDILSRLKTEKIDSSVIPLMSDQSLANYFPKYGDRVAVVDFCQRKVNSLKKKEGLLERLRKKIKKSAGKAVTEQTSSSSDEESLKNTNKKRKIKKVQETRQIELGWLCSLNGNRYVQVRTKQGGGTRKINVAKDAKTSDILEKAIEIFFPNGISCKGDAKKFSFHLRDFKQNAIIDDYTVNELYRITGLSRLRFYLSSSEICETTVTLDAAGDPVNTENSLITENVKGDNEVQNTQNIGNGEGIFGNYTLASFYESSEFSDEVFSYPLLAVESRFTDNVQNAQEIDTIHSNSTENNESNLSHEPVKLLLHRGQIMNELLIAFTTLNTDCGPIVIEMLLPNGTKEAGYDVGGIFRDALTEFWDSFYERCTVGTSFKVPILREDFNAVKWQAVSKVLYKGWKEVKYFPIKLAPVFIEYCLYGRFTSDLSNNLLKFVSPTEATVLSTALKDFESVDFAELCDILDVLECKRLPTNNNIAEVLNDISHKDLIQKPKYIIDCWTKVLDNMLDISALGDIYVRNEPTSKNILNNLRYLLTGNEIQIAFNSTVGFQRSPIAHTCGCVLELSVSYENYPDFRMEMNSVLNSNVWFMDII